MRCWPNKRRCMNMWMRMQCRRNKLLIFLLWIMEIRLVSSFTSSILCGRMPGLTAAQRQQCIDSPDALSALGTGQNISKYECLYQFRNHRWNCTQVWQENVFTHVVFVGSREAAYVYAIASAGATHAVTAACARGNITHCGCDVRRKATTSPRRSWQLSSQSPTMTTTTTTAIADELVEPEKPWKWGGCSADIGYGMRFAGRFLDAREIEGDERSLMNLHNNLVGRRMVRSLLRTECKCHGVSGSCVMKTCWKSLPPFRVVGDALMRKYKKAKIVRPYKGTKGLTLILSKKNRIAKDMRTPKPRELVYLQSSPNYCERSVQLGTLGTAGRICNRTSNGPQSCDLLCCGRGYNTQQKRRTFQCRCQFHWCCEVKCDKCEEAYEEFTCK